MRLLRSSLCVLPEHGLHACAHHMCAPAHTLARRPSDTAAPLLAEAEGSSMTPTPGAAPAHAHAGELSPALSSTRSSSTTPAHAAASEQGSAGSAQQGGLGDSAAMAHAKPYAATAPHAPPSTSMVAKLQQRFLQTPQAPARPDEPEPCTPCADSVHAVLRDGSQRRRTLPLRRTGGSSGLGGGEAEEEGEEEEAWQTEAQRTTARAPAPTSLVQERSAALRRISGGAGVMADPSRTPSSNAAVPAAAATAEAAAGGAPVVAATEGQEHKKTVSTAAAPWAQQAAQLQQRLAGKEACTTAAPTAVAAAPSSGVPAAVLGVDGRAPPAGGLAPTKQQLELLEQRDAYSRVAAEQALLLQPHRQRAAGSAECGHKGGPPTSVLAAGPQLAAAGLVSVPPHFLQQQRQQHPMVARGCGEEWGPGEGTAEEEEEEEEEGVTAQQQVLLGGRRRHTAPEALQQKQKLHVRAPRSAPAYSQCPSTPSPTYVGSSGRKRKGGGRGMWGGLLRVLGITTTVASVAVVTGAAVFAAAALNTVRAQAGGACVPACMRVRSACLVDGGGCRRGRVPTWCLPAVAPCEQTESWLGNCMGGWMDGWQVAGLPRCCCWRLLATLVVHPCLLPQIQARFPPAWEDHTCMGAVPVCLQCVHTRTCVCACVCCVCARAVRCLSMLATTCSSLWSWDHHASIMLLPHGTPGCRARLPSHAHSSPHIHHTSRAVQCCLFAAVPDPAPNRNDCLVVSWAPVLKRGACSAYVCLYMVCLRRAWMSLTSCSPSTTGGRRATPAKAPLHAR